MCLTIPFLFDFHMSDLVLCGISPFRNLLFSFRIIFRIRFGLIRISPFSNLQFSYRFLLFCCCLFGILLSVVDLVLMSKFVISKVKALLFVCVWHWHWRGFFLPPEGL